MVRHHSYLSKALGRQREMAVYTPPGYDRTRTRYPTLYLQHGSGDNQATWVVHGKAHWILDNLLAQGRTRPMVVVMMDGHAAASGGTNNIALFERDQDFITLLKEKNLRHEWYLTPGDHSWPVWRTYLVDIAPRLFRSR